MRVILGAALALGLCGGAAVPASAATFDFEIDAPATAFSRFYGSFEAFDLNSDGWLTTDEVLSFHGRAEGGSHGGPSAWAVDTLFGTGWFSISYDLDGTLGDDPLENLSFGYSRSVTCSMAEGFPATSEASYAPSASLGHVSLGQPGGSFPNACPMGEQTTTFTPMQAQVWMTGGTLEAPVVVTPVPLAGLLLASGLGLLALRRRRR